jgi:hypothetical protein
MPGSFLESTGGQVLESAEVIRRPQFLPAQLRQPVHALSQIDGLDGDQDAHLRLHLNYADSHSTRLRPARPGVVAHFQ